MSRKMKRVVFYEDVVDKESFKHQTLVQDYIELQQETDLARNNLMALKRKELILQAELGFLRRRRNFLLKNNERKKVHFEKPTPLRKLPLAGKRKAPQRKHLPELDLILGNSLHGVRQQSVQRVITNQRVRVRVNGPKVSPFPDSSLQDNLSGSQEPVGQSRRKPVIDLNLISREDEELQERCELFGPPTHSLIRNGVTQQKTNVQLSMVGSGTSGRAGKRKISWHDPVALRV